jgi:hypothetical protein
MDLANLGRPPHLVNGHTVEQSRVDIGGEHCVCATSTYFCTLSVNGCERTQLHVQVVFFRGMAVILCNDNFCAAFFSVSVFL